MPKERNVAPVGQTQQASGDRFEIILARLAKIVDEMETGKPSLEKSLQLYEEGVELRNEAEVILTGAEARVELLVARPDGTTETTTFDDSRGKQKS